MGSRARRRGAVRRRALLAFAAAEAVAIAACAPGAKGARPAAGGSAQRAPVVRSLVAADDRPDGLPAEAYDLLARSAADSCSVCARDLRTRAFRILEERFPPGAIMRSDSLHWFASAPDGASTLRVAPGDGSTSKLAFRFHTLDDRLVGIADLSLTDARVAARCRAAPASTTLGGAIEIVPFAYGDGATFLYQALRVSIEVQCRIVEIVEMAEGPE